MDSLADQLRRLGEIERRVISHVLGRQHLARDSNEIFEAQMTTGERLADRVATFGGSWTFIGLFCLTMVVWMVVNVLASFRWDEYPFILLNLVLSCLAALQAPVIMMSQNRQAAKDRLDARHDYEVNLHAETEIMSLHVKMDELREKQWETLIDLQKQQLEILARLEGLARREGV